MTINGTAYEVSINHVDGNLVSVTANGKDYTVELEEAAKPAAPVIKRPTAPTATGAAPVATPASARPAAGAAGTLRSPLPGTVLSVNVAVGDTVAATDCVLVLEAMKMENNINAGKDGTVKAIYVNKGDNILEGADLLLIE